MTHIDPAALEWARSAALTNQQLGRARCSISTQLVLSLIEIAEQHLLATPQAPRGSGAQDEAAVPSTHGTAKKAPAP